MSTWQPIKTAPKDGTHILVYGYECEWGIALVRSFKDSKIVTTATWKRTIMEREVTIGEGIYKKENYVVSEGWCSNVPNPTHWMPLPDAP